MRLVERDAVDPIAFALFGFQRQAELLADHPGQEAADRMLLPLGDLHDLGDGRAMGPLEQAKNLLLLGAEPCLSFGPLGAAAFVRPLLRAGDRDFLMRLLGVMCWLRPTGGGRSAATAAAPRRPEGAGGDGSRKIGNDQILPSRLIMLAALRKLFTS